MMNIELPSRPVITSQPSVKMVNLIDHYLQNVQCTDEKSEQNEDDEQCLLTIDDDGNDDYPLHPHPHQQQQQQQRQQTQSNSTHSGQNQATITFEFKSNTEPPVNDIEYDYDYDRIEHEKPDSQLSELIESSINSDESLKNTSDSFNAIGNSLPDSCSEHREDDDDDDDDDDDARDELNDCWSPSTITSGTFCSTSARYTVNESVNEQSKRDRHHHHQQQQQQQNATKSSALKRVSFGSSKGSMVETLIYDHCDDDLENGYNPYRRSSSADKAIKSYRYLSFDLGSNVHPNYYPHHFHHPNNYYSFGEPIRRSWSQQQSTLIQNNHSNTNTSQQQLHPHPLHHHHHYPHYHHPHHQYPVLNYRHLIQPPSSASIEKKVTDDDVVGDELTSKKAKTIEEDNEELNKYRVSLHDFDRPVKSNISLPFLGHRYHPHHQQRFIYCSPDYNEEDELDETGDQDCLLSTVKVRSKSKVNKVRAVTLPVDYAKSVSFESAMDAKDSIDAGEDNPFRPGGELSREAETIVNLIKEGKPITPTSETTMDDLLPNDKCHSLNTQSTLPVDELINSSTINGTTETQLPLNVGNGNEKSKHTGNGGGVVGGGGGTPSSPVNGIQNGTPKAQQGVIEVQRTVITPSTDASKAEQVMLKKKPKCRCCTIQ